HDARNFFRNDTSVDPFDSSRSFGPKNDPYVLDTSNGGRGCRKQYQILLTDGQPNMDLRPFCEGPLGKCPFAKPEDIAFELSSAANPVKTFVIGFALPSFTVNGQQVTCNDLTLADFDETDPTRPCGNPSAAYRDSVPLQACCVLNRIATKGGGSTSRAFFADDREELASALSQILTEATPVTSRTQPVVSGAAGGSTGFRFYSSVRPVTFQPWVGVLERQRYRCNPDTQQAEAIPINRNQGDDFAANVNAQPETRIFASVRAGNGSEPIHSRRSIRPYYTPLGQSDGAGVYSGARAMSRRSELTADISAEAMALTPLDGLTANQRRDRYLKWLVGLPNGTRYTRCARPNSSRCYLLGDILHSTPRIVGPPSSVLLDETYEAFTAAQRLRPVVLYTSSNDGFLHAFKVAATDTEDPDQVTGPGASNNELWAFLPPAVLPDLPSQYPFTHQLLLDGVPIVEDVVAVSPSTDVDDIRFQRSPADARAGVSGNTTWRTVLIQSFGAARSGYFAVDVTDPVPDANNLDAEAKGPRFLWQLTTDGAGNPLFGIGGATPLITTLFFDPAGGSDQANAMEIPVAILPGGRSAPGSPDPEPDAGRAFGSASTFDSFSPRTQVPRYSTGVGGRSLTIVRLDTGEIIRTFRQSANEVIDADLKTRVIAAPIDSPITGQPSAFPAGTGAVADRAYVGDQDGRLWRVDLSATDPDQWRMELFFDTFPASWPEDSAFVHGYHDGQPIILAPVVSVDEQGDITINIATGDQDTLGASASMKNYVWSLTERTSLDRSAVVTRVNWFLPLLNGERVVGPMELFNSQLFFATYSPPQSGANACSNGSSQVWGVDYLRPKNSHLASPPRNQGGEPRLPSSTTPGTFVRSLTAAQVTGNANAVIFGVSVAQQPTCSVTSAETSVDYLGYGQHHRLTNVNPGKFELVMHTGGIEGTATNMSSNVETIELPAPPSAARVDAWAALIE
ncbi:MAG TPA: hypothetical protein VER33_09755, partial [Polyangiaceae bacterium]|nr:hypothetical protein [Polyangiaceae bacterium]